METLVQIRNTFNSNCFNLLKVARLYDEFAHIIPDFRLHPDKLTFVPRMPNLISMYDEMSKTPDLTERMIQSQMMGDWRIFLTKIFERYIFEALTGGISHKIKFTLKLEFPEDIKMGIADSIQRKSSHEFDRQDYDTQLDRVLSLLGKPIDKKHENIQFIKKHKVIRDVVQHNRGELRKRDFEYLGLSEFSLSNGPLEGEKIYKIGDVVVMTSWEIDQLFKNLGGAAKAMIPNSP